jgi:serine/threonine protein kinase
MDEEELPTYNEKVDVWSVGALTFEALTGFQPFLADGAADLAALVAARLAARDADSDLPAFIARAPGLSAECRDFVARCLEADPAARPAAAELLAHPWIAGAAPAAPPAPSVCASRPSTSSSVASAATSEWAASSADAGAGPDWTLSSDAPARSDEVLATLSLPWLLRAPAGPPAGACSGTALAPAPLPVHPALKGCASLDAPAACAAALAGALRPLP